MRKLQIVVTALSVTAIALTGCGRGGSSNSTSSGGKKALVIGFSQRRVAGSDWYKTLIAGAQAEAAKKGATVQVLDAGGDTSRQIQDVQTLISKNVNVVILN